MNTLSNSVFWSLAAILLLSCFPAAAWGYRSFVSTDAAVAGFKKMEIELGYFNWKPEKGRTSSLFERSAQLWSSADWMFTTGLTFSFSLATILRK